MLNQTVDTGEAELTRILQQWNSGEPEARARVLALLYPELKRIAEGRMRRERPDHTLQPTALVNELFLHLARRHSVNWRDRAHFLAVASGMMKHLLVDYARAHRAQKRGGPEVKLQVENVSVGQPDRSLDLIEVSDVLDRLSTEEPRMAKVVEMRCFGGLTFAEIGCVLGVDERTAKRDWQVARAWLYGQLRKGEPDVSGAVGADQDPV